MAPGEKISAELRPELCRYHPQHCIWLLIYANRPSILINTDWGSHAGLIQDLQLSGGTKKSTAFTWNLPNSGVKVRKGESFSVLLKDNFSDLEQHTLKIQGRFA